MAITLTQQDIKSLLADPNLSAEEKARLQQSMPQTGLLSSVGQGARGILGVAGAALKPFAESIAARTPQMIKDMQDTQRFYEMERMKQPTIVPISQMGQLRQITPAGIAAGLDQYRAAEQLALQKPEIEKLEALAAMKRAQSTGSLAAQKTSPKTYLTLDELGNKKIIETYFDKISGERRVSGTDEAVPQGSIEISAIDTPNMAFLNKLEKTVYEDRDSLNALDSYLSDVKGSSQGLNNLLDRASLKIKTLLNNGNITEEELRTAKGQAKLQGLLGRFRVQIVGGGVMTEQDALRILSALGGDFDAFQNKQVTKELILEIRKETASRFERESEKFNRTLAQLPDVGYAKGIYNPIAPYTNPYQLSPDGSNENNGDDLGADPLGIRKK